jgi:steroid 5-alpha reductase family enzyme
LVYSLPEANKIISSFNSKEYYYYFSPVSNIKTKNSSMWKTIIILIITLILIPVLAFKFDLPLTENQNEVLSILLKIYVIASVTTFVISSLTNNYSQVDKLWSLIPIVYAWVVTVNGGFEPRLVLMAILVSIWGIRLSYNFSRRGGYRIRFWEGEEDYRWAILRAKPEFNSRWKWLSFNLFFISFYQMALILLFTLPILRSMNGRPMNYWDYVIAIFFLVFVIIETIADQQQWNFHKEKNRRKVLGEELTETYSRGFVRSGLWKYVRHPNYAAEQAIWGVFYLFSIAATGTWLNWSIVGFLLLTLLFYSSSNFSERVSSDKYPEYSKYIKEVGRFLPKLL